MSYSDFAIEDVTSRFRLRLVEGQDLYSLVPPVQLSPLLRDTLAETVPLALASGTVKARSEFITAPMLLEARHQVPHASLFSGIDLTVDPGQGLEGACDYLLCRSPEQLPLEGPVLAVVKAATKAIDSGLGPCLATMAAARVFNEHKGEALPTVYGVVTTGVSWRFLDLSADTARVDLAEYHIDDVERVVGILVRMLRGRS